MPVKAAAKKIDGEVTISYWVDSDGHPKDIKIVSAQPKDIFERETLHAVKNWCLTPTIERRTSVISFNNAS